MNITITTPFSEILVSGDTIQGQLGNGMDVQDEPDQFEIESAYVEDSKIKFKLSVIEDFINFRIDPEYTIKVGTYIDFLEKVIYDVEFYKGGELFKEQYEVEDYDELNDKIEANNGGLITITKINIVL